MSLKRIALLGAVAAVVVAGGLHAAGGLGGLKQLMFNIGLTGSVPRTAASKMADWVSVKDFGATGDGVTDDTAAVTAALAVAPSAQVISFPCPGTYQTTTFGTTACGIYYPPLSYTGAVLRPVPDKLFDTVTIKDFGAVCNGIADDTNAVKNAETAAVSLGSILVVNCKARIVGAIGTISGPIRFEGTGAFDLTPGGTVTITGSLDASVTRIFYVSPLAIPVNAAFTSGTGTLGSATYYYRVSAINAAGESFPSTETAVVLVGPAGVNVNWGAVSGATGYKIYGRTTGAETLIATVGAVTTYLDSGSITPSGAMPVTDTSTGLTLSTFLPEIQAAWWGTVGNATADDTIPLQAALWRSQNATLQLNGVHRITAPLVPPQNVRISGRAPLFSGGLFADGTSAITLYGTNQVGGFAFRVYLQDLTIQMTNTPSSTKIIDLNAAYSIDLDHVRIHSLPDNSSVGVNIVNSYDINLRKVTIYGAANTTNTGVFIQGVGSTQCTVSLIEPDIETVKWGVRLFGGAQGNIVNPYMERFLIGVDNQSATGKLTMTGGVLWGTNSGTFCVEAIAGSHTVILGTRLNSGSSTHTLYSVASGAHIAWYDDQTNTLFNGDSNATGDVVAGVVPGVLYGSTGTITLSSGTPSTGTATVFSGSKCVCTNQTTQANPIKCSVSTTTLTATGPNTVTDVVTYFCSL